MDLLAIQFPNFDPVAISIGPISIKWYGLSYLGRARHRLALYPPGSSANLLWAGDKPPFAVEKVDDCFSISRSASCWAGACG